MAKYIIENLNSSRSVNCDILGESNDSYIIRLKNGVVRTAPKDKVTDLDKIDEGVLDTIKNIGQKIVRGVHKLFAVFVKFGKSVFPIRSNGEPLMANSPINAALNAGNDDRTTVVLGSDAQEYLDYVLGLEMENPNESIEEPYYDEIDEAVLDYEPDIKRIEKNPFLSNMGYQPQNTARHILNTATRKSPKGEEIEYVSPYSDSMVNWDEDEVMSFIKNEYEERFKGNPWNEKPICVWGAFGIGKTSIPSRLVKMLANTSVILHVLDENDKEVEIQMTVNGEPKLLPVNVRTLSRVDTAFPDVETADDVKSDLERQASRMYNDDNKKDKSDVVSDTIEVETNYISKRIRQRKSFDLLKSWLPAYNPTGLTPEEIEMADNCVNGGKPIFEKNAKGKMELVGYEPGPGGILFIDEIGRIDKSVMNTFMEMFSDRKVGVSGAVLGSRWVIVGAANRNKDINAESARNELDWEGAVVSRFRNVNLVPNVENYLKYFNSVKRTPGKPFTKHEGLKVLSDFIEANPECLVWHERSAKGRGGEKVSENIAMATLRTWMDADSAVRDKGIDYRKHNENSDPAKAWVDGVGRYVITGYERDEDSVVTDEDGKVISGYISDDELYNLIYPSIGAPVADAVITFRQKVLSKQKFYECVNSEIPKNERPKNIFEYRKLVKDLINAMIIYNETNLKNIMTIIKRAEEAKSEVSGDKTIIKKAYKDVFKQIKAVLLKKGVSMMDKEYKPFFDKYGKTVEE